MCPLFKILAQSKMLWVIYIFLPLILGFIIFSIFIAQLPRKLPIGIINEDQSSLSYDISQQVSASPTLELKAYYPSLSAAKEDLNSGKIYGALILPYDLERKVKLGITQNLPFYYNAQFILVGKALDNALLPIIMIQNTKLEAARELITSQNINAAISKTTPIIPHINPLYNPKNNYAQFLITLILPCLWQILVALGLLNLLSYPIRDSLDFFTRIGFNLFITLFWAMIMVFCFSYWGFTLVGQIDLIFFGFLVLGLSISGVVVLLMAILKIPSKALSIIAAYTAPSLAFAGVTYPESAMESFASFWNHILPISYFMRFYLEQANYASPILKSLHTLAPLCIFILTLPLGHLIYLKRNWLRG